MSLHLIWFAVQDIIQHIPNKQIQRDTKKTKKTQT